VSVSDDLLYFIGLVANDMLIQIIAIVGVFVVVVVARDSFRS
jgi:hypothetical protein